MILHLLRHGQSVWNVEERVQGQTHHVPLTADGVRQAREARERLAGVPLAAVLSSDQVRARQTADVVADAHGLPVRETTLLREQGLGSLEGKNYSELEEEPTPEGVHVSDRGIHFAEPGVVYQAHAPLYRCDAGYGLVGLWVVGDEAVGIGMREDANQVTGNASRFVPHCFD